MVEVVKLGLFSWWFYFWFGLYPNWVSCPTIFTTCNCMVWYMLAMTLVSLCARCCPVWHYAVSTLVFKFYLNCLVRSTTIFHVSLNSLLYIQNPFQMILALRDSWHNSRGCPNRLRVWTLSAWELVLVQRCPCASQIYELGFGIQYKDASTSSLRCAHALGWPRHSMCGIGHRD